MELTIFGHRLVVLFLDLKIQVREGMRKKREKGTAMET